MSTTQLATPEVDIELIDVIDGYNTRTAMDPKRLAELAASIGDIGLREPLTVRPTEEGRYELIAGHRRHRAARMAGLTTVPVTVDPDADRRVATAENDHREDLDPIARAVSYRRLAEERNLKSNREIAAEANKSVKWVGEHLRLLKLPEQVRHHIAAGTVPTSAEPRLRKIAAVSPRIAECLCEVFARDDSDGGDFGRDFDQLIYSLADAVAQGEIKDPPTMIDPRHIRMSEVIDERDQLDELAARHRAAIGITGGSKADPVIALGEVELTVARAAGVLLEYEDTSGGFTYKITYLTDKAMAADLLRVAIEREEKDARKREKEARRREKEFAQAQNSENGDASGAIAEERQRREAEREAAMKEIAERRKAARSYNERVGLALIKRRGAKNRKKFGLARAKAGAISLILHDRTLAAAGLRLVMPQMQGLQTEVGENGSGGEVAYASINQATEFLIGRIEESRSAAEVDEVIADAQIAALLADPDALEAGEGAFHHDPAEERVKGLLAAEIKELAPRRSPKQRKVEKED